MTPAELLASLEGNDDPDAMVLRQMAQIGADVADHRSLERQDDAKISRHAFIT